MGGHAEADAVSMRKALFLDRQAAGRQAGRQLIEVKAQLVPQIVYMCMCVCDTV